MFLQSFLKFSDLKPMDMYEGVTMEAEAETFQK